jgi:TfoX/Sxy family transcriptional regulator of competence genes
MERPNDKTVAYYDRNVPKNTRAVKGQMFGHPCAFVNGNMFFGTFAQTVVARVGEARAAELAGGVLRVFEPMAGRAWKEYVQVDACALTDVELHALALEALEATARMPAKVKKGKAKQ